MTTRSLYAFAADLVLYLHFALAVFVVGGVLLILAGVIRARLCSGGKVVDTRRGILRLASRPLFRWIHLGAVVIIAIQSWAGMICPLTHLECHLRTRAGGQSYPGSFVAHWVERLLYLEAPNEVFVATYTLLGLVVAATWFLFPPRPKSLSGRPPT